jgi:hypothetical protein
MPNKKQKTEAICEWCKKPFERTRKDKRFCCQNCKIYSHLKSKRENKNKDKKV